jgi:hypothetical protein
MSGSVKDMEQFFETFHSAAKPPLADPTDHFAKQTTSPNLTCAWRSGHSAETSNPQINSTPTKPLRQTFVNTGASRARMIEAILSDQEPLPAQDRPRPQNSRQMRNKASVLLERTVRAGMRVRPPL